MERAGQPDFQAKEREKSQAEHGCASALPESGQTGGYRDIDGSAAGRTESDGMSRRLEELALGRARSYSKDVHEDIADADFEAWAAESKRKVEAEPDNPSNWFHYGVALASLGHNGEAEEAFEEAVSLGPRHVRAWYWLGMVRNSMNRDHDALEAHEKATELSPDWARPWCDKGVSLAKLGRYEEACVAFDESLKLDNKDVFAWSNKGCMLHEAGRLEEALEACTRVTELDSESAKAWDSKGGVLTALGRLDEAIECFEQAVELEPQYAGAWHNMGHAMVIQGRYSNAIHPLDRAIELGYPEPKPYLMKIVALGQLGQLRKAMEICDEGLANWRDKELVRLKAGLLGMLKEHEACIEFVNQTKEEGLADDELLFWMAAQLVELERFEEALSELDEALGHSSENMQAQGLRAYCLCKVGRPKEGIQQIEGIVKKDASDGGVWYARAHVYAALDDAGEMLASLRKALELEPSLISEVPDEKEFAPYKELAEFKAIIGK